eukprot:CAMPEP_0175100202 /NCGR_PEP_ID=MMETSP0086_2-20121207/6944_1 /TAXON_ID=136419 /ORGANISM="Unknown Unknown, Strain D1" /LENGTH=251 /DNA_ID=CAMNT_0016374263 /DNA_START=73 /DNA_END=828 /DNA_ORIENTATION=-
MELAATAISAASNTAKGNQFSKCLLDLPGSASNSRKGTAPKVTAAVSCTAKMTLGSTLKAGVMFPRRFATIFRKAVVPSAKNACANTFPRKRKSRSRNPRRNPGNAASGCAETSRLMGSAPTATTAVSSMAPTTPASPTPAPKRKQTADPPAAGEGKTPRKKMATVHQGEGDEAPRRRRRARKERPVDDDEECNNYQAGRCRFGDNCRRKHVGDVTPIPVEKIDEVCNKFQAGRCRFGDHCRRQHVRADAE